jgi:hypothetical protein
MARSRCRTGSATSSLSSRSRARAAPRPVSARRRRHAPAPQEVERVHEAPPHVPGRLRRERASVDVPACSITVAEAYGGTFDGDAARGSTPLCKRAAVAHADRHRCQLMLDPAPMWRINFGCDRSRSRRSAIQIAGDLLPRPGDVRRSGSSFRHRQASTLPFRLAASGSGKR